MIHRHKLAGKVEEVAAAVYRPCCNSHTPFPGCNHGMAMLGLLELMAPQRASADECSVPQNMSTRIVYPNKRWRPQLPSVKGRQ